jgi:hypothetical protein
MELVMGKTPIDELTSGIKSNMKRVIKDEFEKCGVTLEHIMMIVDVDEKTSNKILDIELTVFIDKEKSKEDKWPRGMLKGANIYSHLGWYIGHEAWLPYIESRDIHIIDVPNSSTDIIRYLDKQLVVRYNFIVHLNHYV